MKNLYRPLNIPVSFLSREFNKKKYTRVRHQSFDRSDISDEYLLWISSLGIVLHHAEVFFSIPNIQYEIHQDYSTLTDFPKINWIFGNSTSRMNWYTPLNEIAVSISKTQINTPYVGFKLKDVNLLHSVELPSPSLVQAGIPHDVITLNDFRWCVSTVYTRNDKFLSFNEAVDIFTPFIIN